MEEVWNAESWENITYNKVHNRQAMPHNSISPATTNTLTQRTEVLVFVLIQCNSLANKYY